MKPFSRMTTALALTGIFGAAALGTWAYEQQAQPAAEQTNICVDNILIPTTLEQADFLRHHAAAAYAELDKKQDPKQSPLVQETLESYRRQGKTATITGFNPNGATSTLPDGTKRPVGCFIVTVK